MTGAFKSGSSTTYIRGKTRWLAVIFLVLALQLNPSSAHAQGMPVIDVSNIFQTIAVVGQGIMTNINLVLQQIQNALKSVIETAMARIKNEAARRMMQAQLDQQVRSSRDGRIADLNNKHTISQNAQACALSRVGSAKDALNDAETSSANITQKNLLGAKGISKNTADTGSAGAAARETDILNKSGILGIQRYKGASSGNSVVEQMPGHRTLSGEDTVYEDGDMNISSVLNPVHTSAAKVDPGALQYSLPKTLGLQNGYVTFSDSNGTISSTGDELAFIAAYEFCDHLIPDLPTPTHGSHLTTEDIVNIRDDRANTAIRTAAADRCFASLRYRTACPAGSKDIFKSADGTSCNQIQVAMCGFMTAPPPNGLGMDAKRPSLANCKDNGLSAAEYDRLLATRCHDASYVQSIHSDLDAEDAEHFMLYECPMLEATYEMKMDHERAALEQAVTALIETRGMGSSPNVSSRPVGGP